MTGRGCLILTAVVVAVGLGLGFWTASREATHDRTQAITRADLGDRWPLTVESGVLRCKGSGGVGEVTFASGGTVYAVNGNAKATGRYADISAIWSDDPLQPGIKADMAALADAGLRLCG